jgi:hypothetical protein
MTSSEAAIFLGTRQIELYKSAPDVYIRAFKTGSGIRGIIRTYYNNMVRKGLIMPIDGKDEVYKQELRELCIEFADGAMDLEGVTNMAYLLHILSEKQ